jgi:hypothetical protein
MNKYIIIINYNKQKDRSECIRMNAVNACEKQKLHYASLFRKLHIILLTSYKSVGLRNFI